MNHELKHENEHATERDVADPSGEACQSIAGDRSFDVTTGRHECHALHRNRAFPIGSVGCTSPVRLDGSGAEHDTNADEGASIGRSAANRNANECDRTYSEVTRMGLEGQDVR